MSFLNTKVFKSAAVLPMVAVSAIADILPNLARGAGGAAVTLSSNLKKAFFLASVQILSALHQGTLPHEVQADLACWPRMQILSALYRLM